MAFKAGAGLNSDRPLPTSTTPPDIERVHARLIGGDCHGAYADALLLLRTHPSHLAVGLLVDVAIVSERCDEALTVLEGQRARLPPLLYRQHRGTLSLFAGDLREARAHGEALSTQADGADAGLALLMAVAARQADHAARLQWMRQREQRLRPVPFALLPERWEVQALLGQQAQILAETDRLLRELPSANAEIRATILLHQAMALHDQLRFTDSMAAALRLARSLAPQVAAPPPPQPVTVGIRTRRRQMQILAEIERLVLTEGLPVVLHAGTLLGLTRGGDLLPGDQDLDLATLPPATSADVAAALVATGGFKEQRHRVDTGTFRAVIHQATGLTVDITEYHRDCDRFISRWRHPSGLMLREAAVPAFTRILVDMPGVGRRLPVPDDPAALLAATYGDWRTPDSGFDTMLCAPNLLGFTGFLASVTAIRLADYLLAGQVAAARRLARCLADNDVDHEIVGLLGGNDHAPD